MAEGSHHSIAGNGAIDLERRAVEQTERGKVRFWLICAFVGLLALAALVLFPHMPVILEKCLEALVVSSLLAATLDQYVKRKLATELATEITPDIVRRLTPWVKAAHLPDEIGKEIDHLFGVRVVRRHHRWKITFSEHADPNLVWVETTMIFTLENLCDTAENFTHHVGLSNLRRAGATATILAFTGTGLSNGQDYDEQPQSTDDPVFDLLLQKQVSIAPAGKDGSKPEFVTRVKQAYPSMFETCFISRDLTLGIEVEVNAPPSVEFKVIIGHRRFGADCKRQVNRWVLNAALPPMSVSIVEWRPSAPPAPTAETHSIKD